MFDLDEKSRFLEITIMGVSDFLSIFIIISCMLLILFLVLKLYGKRDDINNKLDFGALMALAFSVALWAIADLSHLPLSSWCESQWLSINLAGLFFSFCIMFFARRTIPSPWCNTIFYICIFLTVINLSITPWAAWNNFWWRLASALSLSLVFMGNGLILFYAGLRERRVLYTLAALTLAVFTAFYITDYLSLSANGSLLRHLYLASALLLVVIFFYYAMDLVYFYTTRDLNARIDLLREEYAAEMETVENVVISLARTIDAKDRYTEGHTERVSQYSIFLGERLGLSDRKLETLRIGALIHDIGKIGIDQNILNKPGKLTTEERRHIEMHPVLGEEICSPLKALHEVGEIIRSHHEKLDGSGYPDGLKGDEISLETRIVTVADIFDALTTERSYRKALPVNQAIAIMKEEAAQGKLDAELIDEFESMLYEMALLA